MLKHQKYFHSSMMDIGMRLCINAHTYHVHVYIDIHKNLIRTHKYSETLLQLTPFTTFTPRLRLNSSFQFCIMHFHFNKLGTTDTGTITCFSTAQCYYTNDTMYCSYLSTFENFPGVESARQLVSDILPIARGHYK